MVSGRKAKRERRAKRLAAPAAKPVAPTVQPVASRPRPAARPCERCGAGCRTEKPLYGWVCARCADQLDRYYQIKLGMVGGNIVQAYVADKRAGKVPTPAQLLP